jgi:hypothetical protein
LLVLFGLWACVRLFRERAYPSAIVAASGLLVVLAAWIVTLELQALGRYSLPLAVTVAGLLGRRPSQARFSIAILVLTVVGAGFMGLVTTRLYYGLPPF